MAEATTLFDGALLDCVKNAACICARCHNTERLPLQPQTTQGIDGDWLIFAWYVDDGVVAAAGAS